jgi:UDP-glucuronate 4-epimerase
MRVLITGAAGFIGYHCARALLNDGQEVLGFDNLNDYYDPAFKHARIATLTCSGKFRFIRGDIADDAGLHAAWKAFDPEVVLHLAAQAGVRYSIENPKAYLHSNLVGFQNVVDLARASQPRNFVYASSSSVYGGNERLPFRESDDISKPISLYAATKISNELVAKTYSHLFKLPSTGLRFFTVYGPFGRPDMALFKFAKAIVTGEPIQVFNHGKMIRDFTYIDDIVSGVLAALRKPQLGQVYNLGRGKQVDLMRMIGCLEQHLGRTAIKQMMPIQAGDVETTLADISKAGQELGYVPQTNIEEGVSRFVEWFLMHGMPACNKYSNG